MSVSKFARSSKNLHPGKLQKSFKTVYTILYKWVEPLSLQSNIIDVFIKNKA